MKKLLFIAVFLMAGCGCGGSVNEPSTSPSVPMAPPVVLAQSGFSNATLTGNYVFSAYMQRRSSTNPPGFDPEGGVLGNLQLNGAGNVTGGSFVEFEQTLDGPIQKCGPVNVLSGSTYSVDGTGALVVSLITNAQPTSCAGLVPSSVTGLVQQNGQGFVFVGTNANPLLAGSGLKQ